MKVKLLIFALLPLLFASCDMNDLFDEGDTKKTYDGPAQVAFFPDEREVSDDDGSTSIEIQLIGEQRDSDLAVSFSTEGDAVAGTHYNVSTPSPITLEAGTSTVDIVIELIADSVPDGGEVQLILNLEGADGVEVAENYKTSRIFIQD
ncbi:Calx-beta domain-containing protein [Rhodohalobacter halophilus]|uniref:Calx-beta domain-containing protein n=1 Tax=Rhodohalobacter halophilus TaxID=1812810 RepID=UPI00083F6C17|nr:Calx-beta domain-containing protein [Rhodohalobacter halophilus]